MASSPAATIEELHRARDHFGETVPATQLRRSAVSWGAIAAGATAAASLSLILLILGVGLGLSSVSPWVSEGVSATTLGVSTILWLTFTQLLASAVGGYLAGRLRTRWIDAHPDEVYFRDTAHGFLAWALASLATAALLTSAVGAIVSGGVQTGATVGASVANTAGPAIAEAAGKGRLTPSGESGAMGYYVDSLFRREAGSPAVAVDAEAADSARDADEVGRIFTHVGSAEQLPVEDVRHVGQIVARRTGLPQQDAEKRVADIYTLVQDKARETELAARAAADNARKASAYSALWLFVSLLIGAFVASLSATFGGRRRDA